MALPPITLPADVRDRLSLAACLHVLGDGDDGELRAVAYALLSREIYTDEILAVLDDTPTPDRVADMLCSIGLTPPTIQLAAVTLLRHHLEKVATGAAPWTDFEPVLRRFYWRRDETGIDHDTLALDRFWGIAFSLDDLGHFSPAEQARHKLEITHELMAEARAWLLRFADAPQTSN